MEKINRHNYMIFFIDYFDNTLNEEAIQMLFEFLEAHPDLKEEFDTFENFTLDEPAITLTNKSSLKKHIDESNIEHYIIANLEGELSLDDQKEYTDFIAENGIYASTVERYKRTILPQEDITFPHKKNLKQNNRLVALWPTVSAIAATIILFITLTNGEQQYQFQALDSFKAIQGELEEPIINIVKTPNKVSVTSTKEIVKNNIQKKKEIKKNPEPLIKKPNRNNNQKAIQQQTIKAHPQQVTIENNNFTTGENNSLAETQNSQESNIPTLKQTFHNSIKSKVFKDENKDNQFIDKDYLITATKNKINNSKNIAFEQTQQESRKKTRLKIGKFEFYRNKKV